jgi:hypothetical protein
MTGTPEHAVAALKSLTNLEGALFSLTPDAARYWKEEYGFETIEDLQEYLYTHTTWKQKDWAKNYWIHTLGQGLQRGSYGTSSVKEIPEDYRVDQRSSIAKLKDLPPETDVPKFDSPKAITIIVAGGTGDAWSWGGSFGRPFAYSIDKWK